jgi:hypothetical protein
MRSWAAARGSAYNDGYRRFEKMSYTSNPLKTLAP